MGRKTMKRRSVLDFIIANMDFFLLPHPNTRTQLGWKITLVWLTDDPDDSDLHTTDQHGAFLASAATTKDPPGPPCCLHEACGSCLGAGSSSSVEWSHCVFIALSSWSSSSLPSHLSGGEGGWCTCDHPLLLSLLLLLLTKQLHKCAGWVLVMWSGVWLECKYFVLVFKASNYPL